MLTWALLAGASVLVFIGPTAASGAARSDSHHGNDIGRRAGTTTACDKAKAKLAQAKRRLKSLERAGASSKVIRNARRNLKQAKSTADRACLSAVFDITAVHGKFDANLHRDDISGCTFTSDAHGTQSLGPGAEPAKLEFLFRDRQGRPQYAFSAGEIPVITHGTGTATRTCNLPYPGDQGTTSCTFDATRTRIVALQSDDGLASLDPLTLEWIFGYPSFPYASPASGGSCTSSGPYPPGIDESEDSPGLFVSPINDGTNLLEPVGITKVPASGFAGDPTLEFSGSGSASFGGTIDASWQTTVTLRRR